MSRPSCCVLVLTTFLFSLALPVLHLHPEAEAGDHHLATHHHDFVAHSHLPSAPRDETPPEPGGNAGEDSEIKTVPIEFATVCPFTFSSTQPDALMTESRMVEPLRRPPGVASWLEPNAQPPPKFISQHPLRGPPA